MLLTTAAPALATEREAPNFDARPSGDRPPTPRDDRARARLREFLGSFGALSVDDRTGTMRAVGRLDGFLTGPSARDAATVALGYVRDHADAFGVEGDDVDALHLVRRYSANGVEYLAWEQRYRGIPVADAGLQAAVTGGGRLLNLTGPPAAGLAVPSIEPTLSATDANTAARASGGHPSSTASVERREGGAERLTTFSDGGRASLTLYSAGVDYRLAWRVLAPVSSTGVYDVLVDARSGQPVRRINRVKFAVPARVFRYNPGTAAQTTIDFSPWLTSNTRLEGPNAHAFLDIHDVVGPQEGGPYALTPENGSDVAPETGGYEFELDTVPSYGMNIESDGCPDESISFPSSACTWDPRPPGANSWAANQKQSTTQLFYLVNTFHDHLRDNPDIAFVDGGFRRNPGKSLGDPNTSAPPDASDPVLAQTLDGADVASGLPDNDHVNNANFLTLPDGYPGLMQMYLWKRPYGSYDGSNDASMVFHEYTHGLTDRLITDAAGYGALGSPQAGAMSEGWSDFYALDYLVGHGLQSDSAGTPDVRFGRYFDNATDPLVRYQSIDCDATSASPSDECPAAPGPAGEGAFTYADFGEINTAGAEVHDDGEIWAQTLWSIRSALVAQYGAAAGAARARRYITQAMRLSPPEPSFLEMRDAILHSAANSGGAVELETLWPVFAARGMGWSASTSSSDDVAPAAAFDLPPRAETGDASSIGQTSATVTGSIDTRGTATGYRFEFGDTSSLGAQTAIQPVGAPAVGATLSGLRPATTYHYRVVALRGTQQLPGVIRAFTTSAMPATAIATPPTTVPVGVTAVSGRKITATRKGMFKVTLTFARNAPTGSARLIVMLGKRKRIAKAIVVVRPGRAVIKTLRLNSAGRLRIKPGRRASVRVVLRLPGGQKLKKSMKLTRTRR
jgi:extracellular elastinolytic metalloproteinase